MSGPTSRSSTRTARRSNSYPKSAPPNSDSKFQTASKVITPFVITGLSRPKDGVASAHLCPGDPSPFDKICYEVDRCPDQSPGTTSCRRASALSRRKSRPSFARQCPSKDRGRRESRVLSKHPQPRTQTKKRTSVVTTGSPNIPAFPAQWFTAYSVLSLVTGLYCHHRLRIAPPT